MAPKPPLTLYYRLTIPGTDTSNAGNIKESIETNGVSSYKSTNNRYMCKSDFVTPTKDIICFSETNVPENNDAGLPETYFEIITIISKPYQPKNGSNMITATANFIDNDRSDNFITTVDYVNYTVTGASGKFADYKNLKIIYDKDKIRRTVILS
jgi:hypothetical protein